MTPSLVTLHHLRDRDGNREVDLIVERPDGGIVGIEVKATAAPTAQDARHLIWLRDNEKLFVTGIIFHTGPRPFRLDDRIHALPISALGAAS